MIPFKFNTTALISSLTIPTDYGCKIIDDLLIKDKVFITFQHIISYEP